MVSDVGLKREENQDSYGFAHTDRVSFYLVADGMGGARGGGTASALAIHSVLRNAFDSDGTITEESLRSAIEVANEVIFERSREDLSLSGMGTTIVALALVGTRAILAHVGDSRIYCYHQNELMQVTRDHTLVQELVETGAIKPEDAAHHPIAHMLTRSLGPAGTVQVEVRTLEFELAPGDRFLLCSDGMYNLVEQKELEDYFGTNTPETAVEKLLNVVLERGASDNTTIEIIHVHDLQDSAVDFVIPETGKIRVVTSGEIPDFAPEEPDTVPGEISDVVSDATDKASGPLASSFSASEKNAEKIVESIVAPIAITESTDFLADQNKRVDPMTDVIFGVGGERLNVEIEETSKSRSTESVRLQADDGLEEITAEMASESLAGPEISPELAHRDMRVMKFAVIGAIGVTLGVLAFVIFSDPGELKESTAIARVDTKPISTTPSASAGSSTNPSVAVRTETNEPVSSSSSVSTFGTSATSGADSQTIGAQGDSSSLFPKTTSLFEPSPRPSEPSVDVQPKPIESAPIPLPSEETVVEVKPAPRIPVTIAPGHEEILAMASLRAIPPMPRLPADPKQNVEVAPINWARERQLREQLGTEFGSEPARYLSEAEKKEVFGRKIDVRESIADLDMKIQALGATSRGELDRLYTSVSKHLTNAQTTSEQISADLEQTRLEHQRWKERKGLAGAGVFRIAPELMAVDNDVRLKKQEYDQILLQYRASVESWQENPRDLSRVSQMSSLARDQKAKQSELEHAVQVAVERGLQSTQDRLTALMLASKDIELYLRRLSRHLGFIRGAQPNVGGANQTLLDRTSRERERLTSEFDRLNVQLSEYAENEMRRDAIFNTPPK